MLFKNILQRSQFMPLHFTGAKKNILKSSKIILSSSTIITLCLLSILFYSFDNSSALTYSSNAEVGFTFNPTISVNLSGDLLINNLAPGSSADSNVIDVNVSTNASHGYILVATAGTSSTNTNLINSDNNSYVFASLATNANLPALTTDNTWGYSFSINNGTSWSNYSGLPLDNNDDGETGKELLFTDSPVDNRTIKFKIGAKASIDQAAGTYNNTINFYAITNPVPLMISDLNYMQDFATLSEDDLNSVLASMAPGKQFILHDIRDNKAYSVAKLADNNVWMTQNLDFDIDSTKTYTSADTDLPSGITWKPSASTYPENAAADWTPSTIFIPVSQDAGEKYWNGLYDWSAYYSTCSNGVDLNCDDSKKPGFNNSGDARSKIGNYYNWTAAIAMNNSDGIGQNEEYGLIDQSVCPAGWTLPRAGTGEDSFYDLFWEQYGLNSTIIHGESNAWDYPTYFIPIGEGTISSSSYHSSVFKDYTGAYFLSISATSTNTQETWMRQVRAFVRCIARPVTTQLEGISTGGGVN